MDDLKAYEKVDNTICLNINAGNLKFGLDTYNDGPNGDSCDCKDVEELLDCLDELRVDSRLAKIAQRLILMPDKKAKNKYVFSLDRLDEDELAYIHSLWCNVL